MATSPMKALAGVLAAGSMVLSSAAFASQGSAPAQPVSPWGVLSAMSGGAPTVAVCGGTAVSSATQALPACLLPLTDAPPPPVQTALPPPPPVEAVGGYGMTPLLLGLVALAAGVGFLFLVDGHHHGNAQPISPS